MKFGQIIDCNKGIFSSKIKFFKSKCSAAWFQYISIVLNLPYNKNQLYKTWSRDMFNFDFFEKGLGIVAPPYFVYDFSRKIFLMLYSINWPNFIIWLFLLLLEILINMCIAIVCEPGCNVINFEINLIFLIQSFFYMTPKSR